MRYCRSVESQVLTAVFLPVALGVIMLGLGLSLILDDFARVARIPRAVLVGLSCQMLLLPAAALALAHLFALSPELAVGFMLLAASPGGATANLFSHLANGDVALNITLTAVNSVLSVITLPIIVNLSMAHFMGEGKSIPLQLGKTLQVFAIVLVPVAIGMLIRNRRPGLAARMARPVKILSIVFLVLVVVAAIVKERAMLGAYIGQVGVAALVFNLTSLTVGYCIPLVARLGKRQAVAIGMEVGIHNGTLAIAIASSPMLLASTTMAMPAAVYSLIMMVTAAGFSWLVNRRGARLTAPTT
jgi:BASS family bile acid:Na+ symporter